MKRLSLKKKTAASKTEVAMAEDQQPNSTPKKQPNLDPIINREAAEMFESTTIKYDSVVITISETREDGLLSGLSSEEAMLLCSDIIRQFGGDNSLEEQIDVPMALQETLKVNYGWNDLEYNTFVRAWRRNLYLLRIGAQNKTEVNLREFKRLVAFVESQKNPEEHIGDAAPTPEEQFAAADLLNNEPRNTLDGQ